MNIIHSIVYLL